MDNKDEAPQQGIWSGLRPYAYFALQMLRVIVPIGAATAIDDYIKEWLGPPPAPLVVRAQEVSDALIRVAELVDELQAEVNARMALIESLTSKAQHAEQRADDALRRASLNEEEAKAIDTYLDRAVKVQISESERRSRRREWGLATLGGLVIGAGAIVIVHFLFGF